MNISTRSTVRSYTPQPVEESLLHSLIEQACHTQTMGNLQLYSVVETRCSEMKSRLSPLHYNQPMVEQAPVLLTICADFRRTTDWCLARNASPGYDNLLSYQNAATDALLFAQTFCNLAEEVGLGICFLGTTIYNAQGIIDVLELPKLVLPVATLTVGWPAEQPAPSDRLPLEAILHKETYKPYTNSAIDTHYGHKESLDENKQFVDINEKQNLAQVYTDCRYTKASNEEISKSFEQALLNQEFIHKPIVPRPYIMESRPEVLECDVVRFQNNHEKWVAFVGLYEGKPYEIFTGLMDDEEGISLPKSVLKGCIIKNVAPNGQKRYDFQFHNKRGYKTTVEGLSSKFNPEYWNYAKLISGVLRYQMPLDHVVRLVTSLELDNEKISCWISGVVRALKRYLPNVNSDEEA